MNEFEETVKHVDAKKTTQEHQEMIQRLATEAFKDHELTVESENLFLCKRPESGIYAFRVAFLPWGVIVVYGDIGEMMLQRGGYDWLKGSIRHERVSDYVMEKVRPFRDWKAKEFMPGEALRELREMHDGVPYVDSKGINFVEQALEEGEEPCEDDWERAPNPELAIKIADDWLLYDVGGGDGIAWSRANYEHASDYWEGPYCLDYTANDLWCYFALSWFVRKREEMLSKEAA